MLTVAKFPHAQASCAMLPDEQAMQSHVGQPLKLLVCVCLSVVGSFQ